MKISSTLLIVAASVILMAATEPTAADFSADARSIEKLINDDYAFLERFPGGKLPMSGKLRAEAAAVDSREKLVRYAERALMALADHHAITGSSRPDSWALVPSYSDLWVEPRGGQYVITAVRGGSPAAGAGIRAGDRLIAVDGTPIAASVSAFWADLGLAGAGERNGYAARVLAAGRRDRERRLTVSASSVRPREFRLPNLYSAAIADRPALQVEKVGPALLIRFNDSLGNDATIAAFDRAMATARRKQPIVIDLTDTPSGGNTTIARAVMGWFVKKPTFYQVHNIPAELRQYGVARQWVEQVLPRAGKHHDGPVAVHVGRWTGSMGEGLAIGFDAMGARVEGHPMAGLLGAIYDYKLEKSGLVIKFPVERLSHVNGTPRERFVPATAR